ncbi:hypothetical protein FQN55_009528 [Onygenales sp. PD_40]|nr:hypothetical protein FQN55_009528 [Onygenales sp. PD_40]KAK2781170.1 hypothetical protein FQN52_001750 [Onygenales sp. PD_12]KAK2790050.1 hypothetical protein FQN53_000706 [Emmonsiellopsis sp. PD_33]KAK2797704.1 hypothetical protein FQN51_008283 [Onygenales sp. PD_10]
MRATLSVAAVFAVAVQQTEATYSWGSNKFFPSPSNCDNVCTGGQKAGFDWKDLTTGIFSSFDKFDFSGFTCSDFFGDEKPIESKFQDKCIEAKLPKGYSDGSPKISYGEGNGFSITSFQITVAKDTDVAFLYTMPDGSTCKHTTPCSQGGSEVKNTQCGGAVSVGFSLPQYSELDDCGFAIHKIIFDCNPPDTPAKPPASYSQGVTTTSPPETPSNPTATYSQGVPSNPPETTTEVPPATETIGTSVEPTATTAYPTLSTSFFPPQSANQTVSQTLPPTAPPVSYPTGTIPPETPLPATTAYETPPGTTPGTTPIGTPSETTPLETPLPVTTSYGATPPEIPPLYTDSIVYSTGVITITSCAPEVTNCPADSTSVVTTTIAISTNTYPVTLTETSPPATYTGGTDTPPASSEIQTTATPETSTVVVPGTTQVIGSTAEPVTGTTHTGGTVTEITYTTVTTCPVTNTVTSGTSEIIVTTTTLSTITLTTTGTICPGCATPTAPVPSDALSTYPVPTVPSPSSALPVTDTATGTPPTSPTPSPSLPPAIPIEAPCPSVVPQCLNTWLNLVPKCNSNSDISCFCPSSEFTTEVIACIQSWGMSDAEIQSALSYFTGICAAHVPENPGIITAIPTTITLAPPPPSTVTVTSPGATITPPPEAPCTTITVSQIITVSGGQTTTVTNTITVPQVQFTTETIIGVTTGGGEVGLIPGYTPQPIQTPTNTPPPTYQTPTTLATLPGTQSNYPTPSSSVVLFPGAASSMSVSSTLWILSVMTAVVGLLN